MDKVKVTLVTDLAEVEKRLTVARRVYDERNRRLEAMTDESVDTFYSCLLCQSFAPNHVCVISPERLGLCGAYNWLDGKAAYEIDETGPNQPLKKGECLDPVKGVWQGINEYVYTNSHKAIEAFAAYSIMDRPMTSCGCFEAIVAYVPECNGVMVVNREFPDETPVGMTFSTLAGSVGGGQQTPGFIGCGKMFLISRKFIAAEGGFKRIVWMPKELKELLKKDLEIRFKEIGEPDLFDKIADETVATSAEDVRAFMEKAGHPALQMEDMSALVQREGEAPAAKAAEKPQAAQQPAEVAKAPEHTVPAAPAAPAMPAVDLEALKAQLSDEIRASVTREVVSSIIDVLAEKFLGRTPEAKIAEVPKAAEAPKAPVVPEKPKISAAERIGAVKSFNIRREKSEFPVNTVKLGATKAEGGTREKMYTIGGQTCMPFHLWEGEMPGRPLIAMEVFDTVSEKYPPVLRDIYGDLLRDPAAMAKACVEKYGADLISVRLEGTHPGEGQPQRSGGRGRSAVRFARRGRAPDRDRA